MSNPTTEDRNTPLIKLVTFLSTHLPPAAYLKASTLLADVVEAEQSPEPAEQQWQPIETAPKDGTMILGWLPNFNGEPRSMSMKWISPYSGWSIHGHGGLSPSHWRPHSQPPNEGMK